MAHTTLGRRSLVRRLAAGTAAGAAVALAGCGDNGDGGDDQPAETEEDPNEPGGYSEEAVDPGADGGAA